MAETTFNPDADPETSSVDGWGRTLNASGDTWTNLVNAAGVTASPSDSSMYCGYQDNTDGTSYNQIYRSVFVFDTSSLPDGDTISAANIQLYVSAKLSNAGGNPTYNIYGASPASDTNLVDADFGIARLSSTAFATGIAHNSISTSAFNTFTLNPSGRNAISKTGTSKFCIRMEEDVNDSAPTHDGDANADFERIQMDSADGSNAPKLVVTHASAPDFIPKISIF